MSGQAENWPGPPHAAAADARPGGRIMDCWPLVASVLACLAVASAGFADEPPPGTVRVAGIVLKWLRTDKSRNFARVEPMIRQAAKGGARIVCTTECFLDGYAIADKSIPLDSYRALGEAIPGGGHFRKLAALADELDIHLVAGMLEADGEDRCNTAVLIGPDGRLVGKYRKQRLGHEKVRNKPGSESLVFPTPYGCVGVMICADRRYPDVVGRFFKNGADFLICPSGGMFGPKTNDPILQARSRENRTHIVFVHPAEFLVTGPTGDILSRTILGDRLLVAPEQVGGGHDLNRVFYFDLPLGGPATRPASKAPPNGKLTAMPGNTWLRLKPKGMARARTYSGACMGDGLLWYFGGAHRGYKGNDVQLYDPRAGEWIQATEAQWPTVGSADWKAMVSGGGSTRSLSPTGRPYTEHTYQQVCWQPRRRRFFIVLVSSGTWEFDPLRREWVHLIDRFKDRKADPRGSWANNHVLWEPSYSAPVLTTGTGEAAMYRFDHAKRRWRRLGATPEALKWNEFYSTYVADWNCHLISTARKGWFRFDVPARKLTPVEAPDALRGRQSLSYDAANHVVIALARTKVDRHRQTVSPWALDVKTMKWSELRPPGPAPVGQATGRWNTLWYDRDHNVHLLINFVRRDREELYDGGVTETWAYRYKQAPRKSVAL